MEAVVPPPTRPTHTDLNPLPVEKAGELVAGKLTALICVENFGGAISTHRLPYGLHTAASGQRVGESPR